MTSDSVSFTSVQELSDLCERAWDIDADPQLLSFLATVDYRLGDLGQEDYEYFTDEGVLTEMFQYHSDIYTVFDQVRDVYPERFPLLKVIAAAHPRTPETILELLSEESDPEVLWAVAGNSSVTQDIHNKILMTQCIFPARLNIRPPEVGATELWRSYDPWEISDVPVNVSVAGNKAVDGEIMQSLLDLGHPDVNVALVVRNADRLTLTQWQTLWTTGVAYSESPDPVKGLTGWLPYMARSAYLPKDLYGEFLSYQPTSAILSQTIVFEKATASIDDLREVLAHSPESRVRAGIAHHPQVTGDILASLALDPDPIVREAVIGSPYATQEQKAMAALPQS